MKAQQIRAQFLDFFAAKNHKIVPSAPMVMKDDPTLMFTNAGMNQFKEYFLGNKKAKDTRIADTQKCLRVSGKHNDLEEVGKDTYHHTMFEMLGNWSFGDYFKKEAIAYAWEFLTAVMKIDKNDLYVTVFEGDQTEGLETDNEAIEFWKAHIDSERILMGSKKDNFWEMGDQGPCGPCSEIHVDIRSAEQKVKISGADLVNQDHPQVVEVWNLVFIEFNRKANGSLEKLPEKHVDTGMGFERLCMVVQEVQSNYDTDVFTPLIREIETRTATAYGKNEEIDIAIRVIADHLRAVSFSIADGQLPSNNGAGYVIRRILRRAIRYGYTFLDQKEPFIFALVDTLTDQMGAAFPELKAQQNLIQNVIKEEEQSFLKTLAQGLVLLNQLIASNKGKELSGAKAFELYDTFGFPVDLTALILSENNMTLNEADFNSQMEQQKARSRAAAQVETEDWIELRSDDEEEFVGYDTLKTAVRIVRYRKVTTKSGASFQLVFNLTPFYPEGGGQVGDKGYLEAPNGNVTYITDTKRENNLIVHVANQLPANLNATFTAVVDAQKRTATACNHTATHLLHQALQAILGDHISQKGSMVRSGYLRFDFSHFAKLTQDELTSVEAFVNARIQEQIDLEEHRNVPFQQAMDSGATALFGEKYGDTVRTIRFGESMELCGGTHVANTAELWHFTITSESAVAFGIRRIEAVTSDEAKKLVYDQAAMVDELKVQLKNPKNLVQSVQALQDENTKLRKEIEQLNKQFVQQLISELESNIVTHNGRSVLLQEVALDAAGMKDALFQLGNNRDDLVAVLASRKNDKPILSCYVSKAIAQNGTITANAIIKEIGQHIQGGGGGQPFFATAGGKNPDGIPKALEAAKALIAAE
ncbi:MAG: alanine--tRNA ligase [Flavobacteriales bacterium]|nr:MAG: alanine--tRNA ligase [Flavobacteriales bacterium]